MPRARAAVKIEEDADKGHQFVACCSPLLLYSLIDILSSSTWAFRHGISGRIVAQNVSHLLLS